MAEAMTLERCREVLTDSAEGQERCARQSKSAVAASSHSEHAAALRLALARLAALDAVATAAKEMLACVRDNRESTLRLVNLVSDRRTFAAIDGLHAALAQLGGPTP